MTASDLFVHGQPSKKHLDQASILNKLNHSSYEESAPNNKVVLETGEFCV